MAIDKLMDRARDELFSHINRCGVLNASPEDQESWMSETIDYLAERYPDLGDEHLDQLQAIGLRFCQPAIVRNPSATAVVDEPVVDVVETSEDELEEEAATVA